MSQLDENRRALATYRLQVTAGWWVNIALPTLCCSYRLAWYFWGIDWPKWVFWHLIDMTESAFFEPEWGCQLFGFDFFEWTYQSIQRIMVIEPSWSGGWLGLTWPYSDSESKTMGRIWQFKNRIHQLNRKKPEMGTRHEVFYHKLHPLLFSASSSHGLKIPSNFSLKVLSFQTIILKVPYVLFKGD